jgi:riboflavin kinase/FMN adenylyltransferase
MRIYYHIDQLPFFKNAVITIGTFDGVHTGHAQILEQLRAEAARIGGETVIVTFFPHPRKVVRGGSTDVKLLNTLEEKIQLLSWQGVDHLVVVPFTEAFSQLTAEEYIREFLLRKFRPHTIIIGYDHRYGRGRLGDYHLLEQFSQSERFELQEIPVHLLDAVSVSSTRIREAIGQADIGTANQLLGYPYFFSGQVAEGRRLGRTIGYPTANLVVGSPEKLIPADGVYAVEVSILPSDAVSLTIPTTVDAPAVAPWDGVQWKGMMNIGMRPTVDGRERTIEVNIFDFNGDLYRRELRVAVRRWLRGEEKFNGLEGLKTQLAKDKVDALAAFRSSF